jgi:hypothetical protein
MISDAYAMRGQSTSTYNQHAIDYYESQLEWLTEVKGSTVATELKEGSEETEDSWIRTKQPLHSILHYLQGPIDASPRELKKEVSTEDLIPCGLYAISSVPMSLIKLYNSGLVDIFLCFEEIGPKWHKMEVQFFIYLVLSTTIGRQSIRTTRVTIVRKNFSVTSPCKQH